MLTLFNGVPGARRFRRHLSEQAPVRPHDARVIAEALALMDADLLEREPAELTERLTASGRLAEADAGAA